MKSSKNLFLMGSLLTSLSYSCPDFGVAVKDGGQDFASASITAWANKIYIRSEEGVSYSINFKIVDGRGKWCYEIIKKSSSFSSCDGHRDERAFLKRLGLLVGKGEGVEIPVRNKAGELTAVITMQNGSKKLPGTTVEGSTMRIIKAQEVNGHIRYSSPVMRFAYSADLQPKDVNTNQKELLEKTLNESGVSPEVAMEKYSITHHLYMDLYKGGGGVTGGQPKIYGSLNLEKKEVPFAPLARGLEKNGEADLSGKHWVGKKDASGCETKVEAVNATRHGGDASSLRQQSH